MGGIRIGYTVNPRTIAAMILLPVLFGGCSVLVCVGLLFPAATAVKDAKARVEKEHQAKAAAEAHPVPPPAIAVDTPEVTQTGAPAAPRPPLEAERPEAAIAPPPNAKPAPPTTSPVTPPATAPDPADKARDEKRAASKLVFAKNLLRTGKRAEANEYLDEVLEKWPHTEAAREAETLRRK